MTEWNDFITSLKLSLRNMYMYYKIKKNMKYTLHLASFSIQLSLKILYYGQLRILLHGGTYLLLQVFLYP